MDRCICPALCWSRQTLEKNVLSWALAGTGSVLFTRQVAVQPTCRYTVHACACTLPLFVWRVRIWDAWSLRETIFLCSLQVKFLQICSQCLCSYIMASPGDKKGQRRGLCGHIMASFDVHKRCARCRDKGIGDDDCVEKRSCVICDGFTETQKEMLATPIYKIRKDKKSGVLVSPDQVTVIASVEDKEPIFHSSPPASQPSTHAQSEASTSTASFVTSDQLQQMSDQWAKQFACFEALLSRGNVFSTPKATVQHLPSHAAVSDTPFIPPSAWLTVPVEFPAEGEVDKSQGSSVVEKDVKGKRKSRKSHRESKEEDKHSKKRQSSPSPDVSAFHVKSAPVQFRPSVSAQATSGPEVVQKSKIKARPVSTVASNPEQKEYFLPGATGQGTVQPGSSGQALPGAQVASSLFEAFAVTGAYRTPPEPDTLDVEPPLSDASCSEDQVSDEGETSSDILDRPEQTEDMSYRETVRSIRSFMGWNHIPTFESDLSEPDKSNNPWKGKLPKRPARISVAMPPDDWLCQKLEKLNTVVAEGYPSRAQDSAGLKKDQFVKVTKSQNRWYQMHMIRPEGPHRPGKTLFSWHDSEAKVNSQFPRIVKAAAHPSTIPPSRPISKEYLRRWERCSRENSYIVNHAAGFNRCTSELQEHMTAHINMLHSRIKYPRKCQLPFQNWRILPLFTRMCPWQWALHFNTWWTVYLSKCAT